MPRSIVLGPQHAWSLSVFVGISVDPLLRGLRRWSDLFYALLHQAEKAMVHERGPLAAAQVYNTVRFCCLCDQRILDLVDSQARDKFFGQMSERPDPSIFDEEQYLRSGDTLVLPESECDVSFKIEPDATRSYVVYHSPAPTDDTTGPSGVFVTRSTSSGRMSITIQNMKNVAHPGSFLNVGVITGEERPVSSNHVPQSTATRSSRIGRSAPCKVTVVVPKSQPLAGLTVIPQGATTINNPRQTG